MKSKVKKALKIILIIFVVIIMLPFVLVGTIMAFVPITRPDEAVRSYVLRRIPMGTDWDEVIELLDEIDWEIDQTRIDRGLRINDNAGNVSFASEEEMLNGTENPDIVIVGSKAMFVELGEFYSPFNTAVSAYMAFDEKGELVEVVIRRDIDAF